MLGNAYVFTLVSTGYQDALVKVEANIARGLPCFHMVGLAEKGVKESRDRVRAALVNSGFVFPKQRVLVNLSPGDLTKTGCYFDLAVALSILMASGQIVSKVSLDDYVFASEVGLTGSLMPLIHMPLLLSSRKYHKVCVVSSHTNVPEPIAIKGSIKGFSDLNEVCHYLCSSDQEATKPVPRINIMTVDEPVESQSLADMNGSFESKLALITAIVGRHHLLFVGPPGVGKSMLMGIAHGLQPKLDEDQMLEVALLHCQHGDFRYTRQPPLRQPHHHITGPALMGGGSPILPGEVSLAHHGVLFLDELTEYARVLLDQLRQPLIDGKVSISRAYQKITWPAHVQLFAAMNPCPCGYWGIDERCFCGYLTVKQYQKRLSGPFLDRIDISVMMDGFDQCPEYIDEYLSLLKSSCNESILEMIQKARDRQFKRQGCLNRDLSVKLIQQLGFNFNGFTKNGFEKLSLRRLKIWYSVALSLADIQGLEPNQTHYDLAYRWCCSKPRCLILEGGEALV
ncbi:MAG: YifB family Mg chelatase-like AAA ATPase [Pseudomonadota bacterium]|nr:YifB family Mg chelatase-like AAA ATPase [Pseudomonadota bacterium]